MNEQQLAAVGKTESDEQLLSLFRHSARADEQSPCRDVLRHSGHLGFGGAEVGHHLLAVPRKRSFLGHLESDLPERQDPPEGRSFDEQLFYRGRKILMGRWGRGGPAKYDLGKCYVS